MSRRARAVPRRVLAPIGVSWEVASAAPGSIADPSGLDAAGLVWTHASGPTTAAATLRAAGEWSLDAPPRRFDAEDWWWRVRFVREGAGAARLHFGGLATLADVWLNGARILESDNMFLTHDVDVTLAAENELVVRCRSLDAALAARRPRPRWRAPMVENQQLRWFRTTLLGRTPGWSPPAAPVGPWRPLGLVAEGALALEDIALRATVSGTKGVLSFQARLASEPAGGDAHVVVTREGRAHRASLQRHAGEIVTAEVVVEDVARWWPHTHGAPALHDVHLELGGACHELGRVGFREVRVDQSGGRFALLVNGARVFCRGACWTPLDPVSLASTPADLNAALAQAAAAGMNMIRVGGTMVYEDDAFWDAADALGILVWQDLMFANLDYPDEDAAFRASAEREARQHLEHLAARPSLAVVCGNSEVEQQAAMFGAPRERWSPPLFHEALRVVAEETLPGVPYWPSSAHGGAFPHQADVGTTSYYGVGAYLRPLEDARRSEVRFATECLAFANVPSPATLAAMPGGEAMRVHHPAWKARVPRDLGAGWDFDDVRDHYVAKLFGLDPLALRYADHDRYLALGRVATGEVMAQAFGEWRRAASSCGGGLVWFLRDLWSGAGWGVVSADGLPKAAFHYLKRALAPVVLHVSEEGVNGFFVHAVNDGARPLEGELALEVYRRDVRVSEARAPLVVPARGATTTPALALFGGFSDLGHAYRFGPAMADLVVARFSAPGASVESFAFPVGLPSRTGDPGLTAEVAKREDGDVDLTLASPRFAQSIAIDADGHVPDDAFFHLAPGARRTVKLVRLPAASARRTQRVTIAPLNGDAPTVLTLPA